jgi:hypothetical protein
MSKAGEKLLKASDEALMIAKCEHAFVMTPDQPNNKRLVKVFCPRCGGTFTMDAQYHE